MVNVPPPPLKTAPPRPAPPLPPCPPAPPAAAPPAPPLPPWPPLPPCDSVPLPLDPPFPPWPPFPPNPPMARLVANVLALPLSVTEPRLNSPPPSPAPPASPAPAAPPPLSPPLPPLPEVLLPTVPPTAKAPVPPASEPINPGGDIFPNDHREKRHLAPGIQDSTTVAGHAAVLDRHIGDRHLAAEDLEDSIEVIAVDNGAGGALSFDGEIVCDIEIGGGAGVFARAGDREREIATGQDDGVRAASRIGGLKAPSRPGWRLRGVKLGFCFRSVSMEAPTDRMLEGLTSRGRLSGA
jgi:hypothetical protein